MLDETKGYLVVTAMAQGSKKKTRSDINLHILINIRDCQKQLYPPKNREKGFRGEFVLFF